MDGSAKDPPSPSVTRPDLVLTAILALFHGWLLHGFLSGADHEGWPRSAQLNAGISFGYIALGLALTLAASALVVCFANWLKYTGVLRGVVLVLWTCMAFWSAVLIWSLYLAPPRLVGAVQMDWAHAKTACHVYVEAQRTYLVQNKGLEYAQTLSDLYESKPGAADRGLVSAPFVLADGPGGMAWKGYLYRILKAQGPDAKGGVKNFLTPAPDGGPPRMTQGFALVAAPAVYEGPLTPAFIVCQTGVVYECDLGAETPQVFEAMTEFNPSRSGKHVWIESEPR